MNLPGLQQRPTTLGRGQKGGGSLAVVFKSRPVSVRPRESIPGPSMRVRSIGHRWPDPDGTAWQVSVELQATASGALLRRIKILITDETRPGPAEAAWR